MYIFIYYTFESISNISHSKF